MAEANGIGEWTSGGTSAATIFALATAAGRAGVAVIRISGPKADDALGILTGRSLPALRRVGLRDLKHPLSGELIDKALVLRFGAGASFTGEPVVELHLHGGRAVVSAALEVLGEIKGLRSAAPGEFTRRAFENGQLDLAQVEGLADLISAETELQRRQAVELMGGALSGIAERWRSDLVFALAMMEATIDWADEEVPEDVSPEVLPRLVDVRQQMLKEIDGAAAARSLRDGFEVAVMGAPNVGKSSLINAISRRESSIISETPGTTRDVIEVRCDLFGAPVTFLDTAGLRKTEDAVEKIGVERALTRAAEADVRVLVDAFDGAASEQEISCGAVPDIRFWNKADRHPRPPQGDWIVGSAASGENIDQLLLEISGILRSRVAASSLAAHERVVSCLRSGANYLGNALDVLAGSGEAELVSEEIRQAIRAVEEIVGRVEADDMLDVVFSRFCMGK